MSCSGNAATRGAIIGVLQDLTGRAPCRVRTSPIDRHGRLCLVDRCRRRGRLRQCRRMGQSCAAISVLHHRLSSGRQRHRHGLRLGWSAGGYGRGAIEYASLEMVQGQVTDDDIYAAVADVLPVAAIGWTRITN